LNTFRPRWDLSTKQEGDQVPPEEAKMIYKKVNPRAAKQNTPNNKYGVLIKPIEDWDLLDQWANGGGSPTKFLDNPSPELKQSTLGARANRTPVTAVSTQLHTP